MKTFLAVVLAIFLSGSPVRAQQPVDTPKTATPSIVLVRKVDRKKREVTLAVMSIALQPAKDDKEKKKPPLPPTVQRELKEFSIGLDGFECVCGEPQKGSNRVQPQRPLRRLQRQRPLQRLRKVGIPLCTLDPVSGAWDGGEMR